MPFNRASNLVQDALAPPLVSIDEVRAHLRIRHERDDPILTRLLAACTTMHEDEVGRQLMDASFVWNLTGFPRVLWIPRPPTKAITKIEYLDTAGVLTLLPVADYQSDLSREPAMVIPAFQKVWPTIRSSSLKAVVVTFTAGYGADPLLVPQAHAARVLALVERNYRHSDGTSDRFQHTVSMGERALASSVWVH